MKRTACWLIIVGMVAVAPAAAQATKPADRAESKDETKVVSITVRAAAEPDPALKHLLLPGVLDRTDGDAMGIYNIALAMALQREGFDKTAEEARRLLTKTPLGDLRRSTVQGIIDSVRIRQLELAARRETCRWDLPVREEGYNLLLPSLGTYRSLATLLALEARLLVAEGRHDRAIHKLQSGLAMARHVAEGPTLINDLVGTAVANRMLDRVVELIGSADSPNLYWALSDLPRPFIDLRKAMELEAAIVYFGAPHLRDPQKVQLTPQQWARDLGRIFQPIAAWTNDELPDPASSLGMVAWCMKMYPEAKRYLISQGRPAKQVDAMPIAKVVAIYSLGTYAHWRDEVFKWHALPYWQAHGGIQRSEQAFSRARRAGQCGPLAGLLPSLGRAYFVTAKLDRQIAALRCIEAIRLYAAGHDGTLPAGLDSITEVPIPANPLTGKPFGYKVDGNTATLEAAAPEGSRPKDSTRYVITLSK